MVKGRTVLNSTSSRYGVEVNGNVSMLTVYQLLESDAGFYQCTINYSDKTKSSDKIYLNVDYVARVLSTTDSKPIYLQSGRTGLVPCYIDSNPPIMFATWLHNETFLDATEGDKYEILGNGSLIINPVEESDGGSYTCTPYNIHGTTGTSSPMDIFIVSFNTE